MSENTPFLNLTKHVDGDLDWGTDDRANLDKIDNFALSHTNTKATTIGLGHIKIDSSTLSVDVLGKVTVKDIYIKNTGDDLVGNLTVSGVFTVGDSIVCGSSISMIALTGLTKTKSLQFVQRRDYAEFVANHVQDEISVVTMIDGSVQILWWDGTQVRTIA